MDYKKLLQQSIDLHVHVGPEIVPRRFTVPALLKSEKNKLKGIAVKNHFFPAVAMGNKNIFEHKDPFIIYSVVLNNYLGGFNADIVRASAELSTRPIIVWFPTMHTDCFLKGQKFEIAQEWIAPALRKKMKLQLAKNVKKLTVLDRNNKVKEEVIKVLKIIKQYNAILATGHLSWKESRALVKQAAKIGIKKIIVTHPIYHKIDMPTAVQKELAKLGAYMEHCLTMYSIDKISVQKIAKQIKEVGARNCILSSDVGQTFSPTPSEALKKFSQLLKKEKVSDREIRTMLITNPNELVKF